MNDNEKTQLIRTFYHRFQARDWKGMADCYHKDIFFYDPVFQNLEGPQVSAMWAMLLKGAKDLQVTVSNIAAEGDYGSCNWTALYTFSPTGRKVENKVKAHFTFAEGRIIEHQDEFSFWRWSRQALGLPGLLFGWSAPLQRRVQKKARKQLLHTL